MKKPDFKVPEHDGKLFSWNGRHGATEISNLSHKRELMGRVWDDERELMGRVWADACDIGFFLKGRTETRLFVLESTERQEGDVLAWRFVEAFHKHGTLPVRLTVFND